VAARCTQRADDRCVTTRSQPAARKSTIRNVAESPRNGLQMLSLQLPLLCKSTIWRNIHISTIRGAGGAAALLTDTETAAPWFPKDSLERWLQKYNSKWREWVEVHYRSVRNVVNSSSIQKYNAAGGAYIDSKRRHP
jgi:hypothetical protein